MIDKIKILAAVLVFIAGIAAYYYLPDLSVLIRVGLFIGAIVVSAVLVMLTEYGQNFIGFAKAANTELRKMVWPTRPETVQTTIMVLVLVVIVALFLWGVDAIVFKSIYGWILGVS